MDEAAKQKLDQLFQREAERTARADERKNAEAEAQAAFIAAFRDKRESVVVPALEEFAAYVGQHGWGSIIKRNDEDLDRTDRGRTSATITFFKGNTPPSTHPGQSLPYFAVVCDRIKKQAYFHVSTIGPGHGGHSGSEGGVGLVNLTSDLVQAKLVDYFARLLDAGRPYDQR